MIIFETSDDALAACVQGIATRLTKDGLSALDGKIHITIREDKVHVDVGWILIMTWKSLNQTMGATCMFEKPVGWFADQCKGRGY